VDASLLPLGLPASLQIYGQIITTLPEVVFGTTIVFSSRANFTRRSRLRFAESDKIRQKPFWSLNCGSWAN
ncbi:MAG: hypothetical protein PHV74_15460, partial [Dehalococcoidia bacterium]|nr:hypothetical protein [Dehalococcoidia bacterium]